MPRSEEAQAEADGDEDADGINQKKKQLRRAARMFDRKGGEIVEQTFAARELRG